MKHGNEKYDFNKLAVVGDTYRVKPANVYSLKSAMRAHFGKGAKISKAFKFDELGGGNILITRLPVVTPTT